MPNRNGTRPAGTRLFVPGYMPDDMQSEFDMQQDQFAGSPFRNAQRRGVPYAGMRRPGTLLGDRPASTDCFVPGYLSDEAQHCLDDEALGIAPLVIAGAMKIPSLLNPKATRKNVVQRFQIMQSGGTPRGSKIGGIGGAKTIIDQVYSHMRGDDPSWMAEWNQIYSIAIPDLKAYMQLKVGAGPATKPGQPVPNITPPGPATKPGQPVPNITPPAPVGAQPPVSTQPPSQLSPWSNMPVVWTPPQPTGGPVPVDYTDQSTYVPGSDQPAPPAAPKGAMGGLMDMLSTPQGLALAGVAVYLLFGGGKKGRR